MGEDAGAPLIGISAYCERARWGVWEAQAMVLPRRYADRVSAAGGIPVLLPPVPGIEDALGRLDGLLLSGGGDIDPARYRAEPAPQVTSVREERDTAEFALLAAAMSRSLPVLGICRGMQVINVARGGSLHQHLPDVVGHDGHAPVPGAFGEHEVRVAPGSRLSATLGRPSPRPPITTRRSIAWARGSRPPPGRRTARSRPSRPTAAASSWWPSSGTPRPATTPACSAPWSPPPAITHSKPPAPSTRSPPALAICARPAARREHARARRR